MKVTCSILCYNYGRYLGQAIDSCLNQVLGDYSLEILVIDDGSTDETPEVCQHYQDSIRVSRSENQGFGATLTKCIQEAEGDYVCLLDADDYFAPAKIVTLLPAMKTGYLYIDHYKYHINIEGNLISHEIYSGSNTSTLCLNRRAALTLLPVDNNEIFFHPLKSAGHGLTIDNPLSYYRIHNNSMTNYQKPGAQHQYLAQVTHALADRLLLMSHKQSYDWADPNLLKQMSQEYRAVAYYDEMEAALEVGQQKEALEACWRLFTSAIQSRTGLTYWHFQVITRGLLGKPISTYKVKDNI
ncbi:glycosyltransferase family A protein [Oscillatoria amoena NRMC-F 0135]|nr:glycosyltransferase family A protein [Geitlerinema splendidum]MDL5046848.1 glycosyltransferase family A protein [Oscillatoria amoena NRMC-F 0135]